jgi:hypothetical protein
MKLIIRAACPLAFIVAIVCFGSPAWSQSRQSAKPAYAFRVGVIKDSRLFHEAGCSMQLPADWKLQNEAYIFISDFENRAFVNVDGQDITLRLDEKRDEPLSQPRKGLREKHFYRGEGIEVVADFVVTRVCPPDCESCEVTHYDGKITISRGDAKRTIAVQGICGS